MSSREMSMDTIMEDEDSFVSNTNAIIYASSDISGWTHSLISDNNIPNSSSSTSVDDRQQQISTAGGGGGDDSMIVSSGASSSWFNNNRQIDDQQEIRLFNVDFRALCNNTCGLLPDTGRTVNEETSVRLVNTLMACAEAIQENNLSLADVLISDIRRLTVSQIGGAMKKVATYFTDALYHKIHRLIPQDIVESSYSTDQLLHMSFYESCPLLKFAHFSANQSILNAFSDSKRVHALALRPGGPPTFRLSGISGNPQPNDSTDPLQEVGFKLAQFAESIGVEFEFRGFMAHSLADLEASMLNIRPSNVEAVAVNSIFELHPLFSTPGAIEKVLDLIKQIQPKIVTIAEQEANHNGSDFMNRIKEAWLYYSTMFDVLENSKSTPTNIFLNLGMTEEYLWQEIYNLVACEGTKRVVRHETLRQWRVRLNSAGFNLVPRGSFTLTQLAMLLDMFLNLEGYILHVEDDCFKMNWHNRPLITTSVWRLCSQKKMSSREMSMEDEDSFVSNTNAIIYASSDISGWTHSLISDNNIPNTSSSANVDDRQQQILTAGGGGDSMIVSSGASSSWFNNNKQLDDHQEIRIFNVDFRALCNKTCCGSESRGGLPPDTSRIVNEETSVRLVNPMLVFAEAIEENNLTLADVLNSQIRRLTIAMKKMATYFAEAFYLKIHRLIPQDIAESSYSTDQLLHMSFYGSFPLTKLAHFTANQSILEAFSDSKRVHVIDFSLNQGLQWLALLQALALRPGRPPAFRLSGISGQPKSDDGNDPLQEVEFEFCGFLAYTLADLEASMLNIRPSNEEAVAVNSVFELQPLFSIPGAIEKVMDLIKQIEPKIVTITE
ncbi:hypothetical protein H5410_053145 [Solanum commersonii]|uniref:DELLA protein n=1 Tax=Solanum commersonii TaxID=4109 RepID=A0A9J5X5K6_SOLCO|nr:hypothetical protein H5410_053145 [Solanum commersonii]